MNRTNSVDSKKYLPVQTVSIWPVVVIAVVMLLVRFLLPEIFPGAVMPALAGGIVCAVAIVVWWVFFSRTPTFEKWLAIVVMTVALVITSQLLDKSISTAMMGMMFPMFSIPILSIAFVIWIVANRYLPQKCRLITMILTIILASGYWILLRSNGMDGEIHHDLVWRWSETAEEKLIANSQDKTITKLSGLKTVDEKADWPGFRGIKRDGIIHGVTIKTDWLNTPPKELWRRAVGPACSSFAVQGDLLITQEQRGEFEMVSCYNLYTGEPVWDHRDSTRFWDSHAGAGPRSTPTIDNGRIYTLGATGRLNVMNLSDGSLVWSRDAAHDTKVTIPGWGYTASPLVVDTTVYVAIAGELLAYNTNNGNLRWSGTDGGDSYSSPQLMTLDGQRQIVFMNKSNLISYSLFDGKINWSIPCESEPIIQPVQFNNTDILVTAGGLKELKRLTVTYKNGEWIVEQRWKTSMLKPYFNDNVVNENYLYGFDGSYLTCIDCTDGRRKWKGGRYTGEMLLLDDQDLLLILTEKGEIALVKAISEQFIELARIPALKGKTWNHPVLVGNTLIVRNSGEMVAYRL